MIINSNERFFVIFQLSFCKPRAIRYRTSKLIGVLTTDLVSTTIFSKPMKMIRYGMISLLFNVDWRPKYVQMPTDMNKDEITWVTAANASPWCVKIKFCKQFHLSRLWPYSSSYPISIWQIQSYWRWCKCTGTKSNRAANMVCSRRSFGSCIANVHSCFRSTFVWVCKHCGCAVSIWVHWGRAVNGTERLWLLQMWWCYRWWSRFQHSRLK